MIVHLFEQSDIDIDNINFIHNFNN